MPCEIEDYEAFEVSKILVKIHNNRGFLQEKKLVF